MYSRSFEMHLQQIYRRSSFNVGWMTYTLMYNNSLSPSFTICAPSFTTCSPCSSIGMFFTPLYMHSLLQALEEKFTRDLKSMPMSCTNWNRGLSFLHEHLPLFILHLSDSQEFIKESLVVNQMQMRLCPNLHGVIVIQSFEGLRWWTTQYMYFLNKDTSRKW